jgi:hypothetical protein
MTEKGPEGFSMIGLHKLADQTGDAMVPELYQLLVDRDRQRQASPNVVCFPFWAARLPGEAPEHPLATDTGGGQNVIAFGLAARDPACRRKKV